MSIQEPGSTPVPWAEVGALTPRRARLRELATQSRTAIELLVTTAASAEELQQVADQLGVLVELLDSLPSGETYSGFAEAANAGPLLGDRRAHSGDEIDGPHQAAGDSIFFDRSPLMGLANPLAPPLDLRFAADHVIGDVTFGTAYEGPPGCVHGGYIAAVFDELLGGAQSLAGHQGMTASLLVNYRSPTPLYQPLRLKGSVLRIDGRKIYCEGWLWAGERLCAQAEALFIALAPGKYESLLAKRSAQADRSGGPES